MQAQPRSLRRRRYSRSLAAKDSLGRERLRYNSLLACRSCRLVPCDLEHVRDRVLDAAKPPPALHRPQERALHHVARRVARAESRGQVPVQPIGAGIVQLGKRGFVAAGQSRRQFVRCRAWESLIGVYYRDPPEANFCSEFGVVVDNGEDHSPPAMDSSWPTTQDFAIHRLASSATTNHPVVATSSVGYYHAGTPPLPTTTPCPTPISRPCSPTASAGPTTAKAPRSTSSRRSSGPSGRRWPTIPSGKLLDFGIGENDAMAPESVRRRMAEEINKPENRGYADNGIRRVQGGGRPVHAARVRRRARPGHRDQPLHRLEDGAGHAAGLLHQPGRRHADDRARLPGRRHAHRATTAAWSTSCRSLAENDFLPDLDGIPGRRRPQGEAARALLSEQPDRQDGHARVLRAGDRVRQEARDRHHPGRGPRHAQLRPRAATASWPCRAPATSASRSTRCPRRST